MADAPSVSHFFSRFASLAFALVQSLGVRIRERAVAADVGQEVERRIRGVRRVVDRMFLRLVEGTLGEWLAKAAARRGFKVGARVSVKPRVSLPRRVGWLCGEMPCTERYRDSGGLYARQFEALLAEPGVRRIMAENPALGRAMRPLFRMLGVDEACYLNVTPPVEVEVAVAEPVVPAPVPEPPAAAEGPFVPWYHQKWANGAW